jgi:hypothetical protein
MNTETTTTVNNIFENKDQYIAFRTKWKSLFAEGFHKAVKKPIQTYNYNKRDMEIVGYRSESPLTVYHHAIFAVATGRDLNKFFSNHRKAKYMSPILYWKLLFNEPKAFDIFEGLFTEDQKKAITARITEYRRSL